LTDVDQRPSPAPHSAPRDAGWWRKLLRPGRFTVLVVLLLLAAAAGYLGARALTLSRQANALAAERSTVVALAGRYAVDLTSYDYQNLDAAFAKVAGESTADFAKQYRSTSQAHAALLRQDQSVSTGSLVATGIQDEVVDRSASVLALVNQSIRNTGSTAPQVRPSELRISLVHASGRWLIDDVTVY
jgi:Mce-associated membrane protein